MKRRQIQETWSFRAKRQWLTGKLFARSCESLHPTIIRWWVLALLVVLFCAPSAPVLGADPMTPEADKILRSMSTFMGGLSGFSADMDVDQEIIDHDGQKLQFSSSGNLVFQRPDKFRVGRQGAIADMDLVYDGKTLTLYGRNLNVYMQAEIAGTIDTGLDALRDKIGIDAPGAELFYSDVQDELFAGVVSGVYLGTAFVSGVECHHLAFREAKVDWQIWISAEGDPLPMKYVITTKWLTGAPQYGIRFTNWNTTPETVSGRFEFKVPEGAVKIDSFRVDDTGKPYVEEKKQ